MLFGLGAGCDPNYDPWNCSDTPLTPAPVVTARPNTPASPKAPAQLITGVPNEYLVYGAASVLGLVIFSKVMSR